jgi:uncharacterized Rossmann fold enzyme
LDNSREAAVMKYQDWKPIYQQIISDFGFNQIGDEQARDRLKELLKDKNVLSYQELLDIIKGKKVYVFGAGSNLGEEVKKFITETEQDKTTKDDILTITADGATSAFIENGLYPNIIVTDLDGYVPDQVTANSNGSIIIVHAHGDNIPALNEWVPKFDGLILGTTQVEPDDANIFNFGGFTDGDRAVHLAAHLKARIIMLVSFEFTEIGKYSYNYDEETKFRKLTWANLLIGMIEEPDIVFQ